MSVTEDRFRALERRLLMLRSRLLRTQNRDDLEMARAYLLRQLADLTGRMARLTPVLDKLDAQMNSAEARIA